MAETSYVCTSLGEWIRLDIYFETHYGRLHEKVEGGVCEVYDYHGSSGRVRHMFIRRKVPILIDDTIYYDLITPYEYGGPLILESRPGKRAKLVGEFEAAFERYCKERNIVSEFVRFHPLIDNARGFQSCYQVSFNPQHSWYQSKRLRRSFLG